MPINVACDHCGQSLQVLEDHAGKQVRCPKCYQVFIAKAGVAPVAAATPPANDFSPANDPFTAGDGTVLSPASGMAPAIPKFCPHCGTGLPANAGFCPACGRAPTGAQAAGGFVAPSFAPSSFAPQGVYPSPYGVASQTCGMATASLVLGIVSFVCLGPLTSIPAVICGHLARGQIRNSNGTLSGDGMALTGLIIGYINLLMTCGWLGIMMSAKSGSSPF